MCFKEPVFPAETDFCVDDITPEKLSSVLFDNPSGVMWSCDELRGLLSSFGRYGGAGSGEAAKSRLLSMYTGEPLRIDRKGQDAIRIKRLAFNFWNGSTKCFTTDFWKR